MVPSERLNSRPQRGLQLGALIGASWLASLIIGLRFDLSQLHPLLIAIGVLLRSFLHTGLFILAHDAMHQSLAPMHPLLNQKIGRLCLWLYAGLHYETCKANHRRHHLMPESESDPDACPANNRSVLVWLIRFLRNYLNPAQLSRLGLILMVLWLASPTHQDHAYVNLCLTYLLPLLISTAQLFVVGTYLPHRKVDRQNRNEVSVRSLNLHPLVSLLACYHFGYHREHHNNPEAPWFLLPDLKSGRFVH